MELDLVMAQKEGLRVNLLHITEVVELQRFQPSQDGCIGPPSPRHLRALVKRLGLVDGVTFHLQVDGGITIGRINTQR